MHKLAVCSPEGTTAWLLSHNINFLLKIQYRLVGLTIQLVSWFRDVTKGTRNCLVLRSRVWVSSRYFCLELEVKKYCSLLSFFFCKKNNFFACSHYSRRVGKSLFLNVLELKFGFNVVYIFFLNNVFNLSFVIVIIYIDESKSE